MAKHNEQAIEANKEGKLGIEKELDSGLRRNDGENENG